MPAKPLKVHDRVIRRPFGRGRVTHLYPCGLRVAVLFDGERKAERVLVRDLVLLPADMPAAVLESRAQLVPAGVA